ncbi:phosphodiester glycosidase family protein [Chitinophaga sp. NPDC101104]|uniref:phosphodiester glycosidase family protein n=1 Tax=Chitinophaga sp. NPDC101104 TaxID=3390561 RepID=UPI003D05AA71
MKPLLLILTMLPAAAMAQLRWQPSAAHNEGLPEGARVYQTTDSVSGRPFRAFYLEIDPRAKDLRLSVEAFPGKRYTPVQYDSILGPTALAIMNTTFFSFKDNSNLNIVVKKGKVFAVNPQPAAGASPKRYVTRGAFGINRKGEPDIAWVYNVGKKKTPYAYNAPVTGEEPTRHSPAGAHRWKVREAVGGGPVLVQNGQPFITNEPEGMGKSIAALHPRSAVGYRADGTILLMVIEGRNKGVAEGANFEEMAKIFTDLGCVEALNLDGGGSSALYVNDENTIKPSDPAGQRPVPAVLVLHKK